MKDLIKSHAAAFGFFDDKGRECGFRYTIHEYAAPQPHHGRFVVWGSPTRAGSSYGPSFNYAYFDSLDKAVAYAEKRTEDCRKRYAKKFVKPPVISEAEALQARANGLAADARRKYGIR